MKKILFLLLFPAFAVAQYPGNAGQKITLGEQTTADGLVYRGRLTDTANLLTNKLDTSVYIVLDTGTRAMWYYRASSTPKWTRLVDSLNNMQGLLTLSTKVTGTLPVANGGTNLTTFTAANRIPYASSATALTTTNKFTFDSNGNKLIIGKNDSLDSNPNYTINLSGSDTPAPALGFRLYNTTLNKVSIFKYDNNHSFVFANNDADNGLGAHRFIIGSGSGEEILTITRPTASGTDGRVGIGTSSPAVQFHTTGGVRFAGLASITDLRTDADGDLFNGSDFNLKNSIDTINFGLSDVLKLKPVSFNWNDEQRNINEYKSMGFIAQDVMDVIPNAASTMGDGDMQVDYNAIVATLTKAIQEQQALIKALEQRILNLENK